MKRKPFTILALMLCLSLCLLLAPGAFAEGAEPYAVRFFNEKGYDLVGLTVFDADGNEIAPAGTDGGYTYLLAPGTYSYAYHDNRDIFVDIAQTGFTVDRAVLEIPVVLKAVCEDLYFSGIIINPIYPGEDVESEILAAMPSREEIVDRQVKKLLAASEDGAIISGDDEVFFASFGTDAAAEQMRSDMVARTVTDTVSFDSTVRWSDEDWDDTFYDVLVRAVAHTGNHREGDTLKEALKAMSYNGSGAYSSGKYQYDITFTFTYRTNAQQEQATVNAVENLISSLGLNGKSDYEKVSAIHEWLYQNVNYDYYNTLPQLRYTDYSVFANRLAVCQGFATAYYRLCLAAGVDARYVSSTVFNHGWNIIRLGGKYYESDATWDSNWREGGSTGLPYFFLRGSEWWLANHTDPGNDSYSTVGDEFNHDSYTLVDPQYGLAIILLQGQYADFDAYVLSAADYDPALDSGVAVSSVNFPDPVFRTYVSDKLDTDKSGYLDDAEIAAVTEINVRGKNEEGAQRISTLKGIEHFPSLLHLDCAGNSLTELDVSKNTALKTLTCGIMDNDGNVFGNQLSKLDVSKNTALEYLYCTHNQISSLDVSSNTALVTLFCYNNGMTQLNISGCTSLTTLSCGNNQLTSLDVDSNNALQWLYCHTNPALGTLDVSHCEMLNALYCQSSGITALNITGCTQLQWLNCSNNSLSSLDLSSCINLHELVCFANSLTELDITGCPVLVLTRYAAEPEAGNGMIIYYDDNFGNAIVCDEAVNILIYGLLELPADVTEIEEEAFADGAFIYVKLAEGTTSVGPRAFANCPNLFIIYVPTQTEIDPTAFDGSYNAYIYRAGADEIVPAIQDVS